MKNIKQIGLLLLCFIVAFIFLGIPCFLLMKFLSDVKIFSMKTGIGLTISFSFLLSIFIVSIITVDLYGQKRTTIINWFSQNYAKLFLFYIVTNITFISLKTNIIFKYDSLKEFLSIQWSILGLAITIFLVWNVWILDFLKKQRPQKSVDSFPIETFKYISEKKEFYVIATQRFNSLYLLIINLFLMVMATSAAFITFNKVTLFNQNLSMASFYFSTNTLISLFFDILLPLKNDKEFILKNMKVTDAEIRFQNRISDEVKKTVTAFEEINENMDMNPEEKRKLKELLLYRLTGDSNLLNDENLLELFEK